MESTSIVERIGALIRADGWENAVLGLGGTKDPSVYTTFASRGFLPETLLEALYVEDHFAACIAEALPRDALRPGWQLTYAADPAEVSAAREAYDAFELELGVAAEMAQGAVWGRVFGGAVTWIGAEDGRATDLPLDENGIQSVEFLHTLDRRDVQVWRYYQDPAHPKFRRPEVFRFQPQIAIGPGGGGAVAGGTRLSVGVGALVHETRCLVWGGQATTDTRRMLLGGWEDSVFERCWDALRQIGEDYGAKSMLLGRVSQAIYKIKDLYGMISGKREEILRKRMAMLDASRSRARAIVLDTEEDFINVTQPLSGVDSLIDRSVLRLSASARMPVAILMGQPLSSLQGTADADLELWSQQADAWRELELRPRHERLTKIILRAKKGPTQGNEPKQWRIAYRPIRIPRPKELAEIRKLQAETDAIRADKGFASAEAIAMARFAPSAGNDLVLDEKELTANLERRKDLAKQPPKDNAELGTVGARASSAIEIIEKVAKKQVSRESGKALLTELFRFTDDVAVKMLGPETFAPEAEPSRGTPGPAPEPGRGAGGAGAPPPLPGVDDGGDPTKQKDPGT